VITPYSVSGISPLGGVRVPSVAQPGGTDLSRTRSTAPAAPSWPTLKYVNCVTISLTESLTGGKVVLEFTITNDTGNPTGRRWIPRPDPPGRDRFRRYTMVFEKYYRELARTNVRNLPNADDAKRDYLSALRVSIDGLLAVR